MQVLTRLKVSQARRARRPAQAVDTVVMVCLRVRERMRTEVKKEMSMDLKSGRALRLNTAI